MNRLLTSLSGYFILIICFLIPATIFAKPAKVKSVTVHFAQLPSINLPCGDLELVYYPEYAQYEKLANLKSSQKPINSIRIQHKKLLKKAERLKKELKKSLDDFLLAAYADFRAKQSQDIKLGIETEIRFLFQQISWYYALSMVNRNDAEIFKTAQEYYKRTAPLFIHLNYKQRVALIEKLSARLACLHEHRQAAFDKVSEAQRYSAEELSSFKKNKTTTKEEASRRATDIAKFASYGREYMWMAAGVSSLTTILRTMLTAHETALLNKKLHPKLMELNEKYGASIGPADRFPNDSSYIAETRRIRLEITKTRAQVALNYMYLKQLQAEKIFVSQLNFASGATAGLLKTGTIAQKAYKDFIRTNDLLPYEEEVKVGKDARKAMQKQGIDFKTFKRKHHLQIADQARNEIPDNAWINQNYPTMQILARRGNNYQKALNNAYLALEKGEVTQSITYMRVAMQNASVQCGQDKQILSLLDQAKLISRMAREEAIEKARQKSVQNAHDSQRYKAEIEKKRADRKAFGQALSGNLLGILKAVNSSGSSSNYLNNLPSSNNSEDMFNKMARDTETNNKDILNKWRKSQGWSTLPASNTSGNSNSGNNSSFQNSQQSSDDDQMRQMVEKMNENETLKKWHESQSQGWPARPPAKKSTDSGWQ